MEQVISQLIAQWGTFGLIIVVTGFLIYDKFIKKGNQVSPTQQPNIGSVCLKGDLVLSRLDDLKDTVNTKMNCLEDKFDAKIEMLEQRVDDIPRRNINAINIEQRQQREDHSKHMEDVLKLGPDIHKVLNKYVQKTESTHIFIGSFHNGNENLAGIPYCKFDIISEGFNKDLHDDRDHEFAPVYRSADILRFGSLPIALVQQESLYFIIDENNDSKMFEYENIIVRRMIGMGIKQIALHILKDSKNRPSGFVGCVKYNYDKINTNELAICAKELEKIYHSAEKN